jgi:hypothetical protein
MMDGSVNNKSSIIDSSSSNDVEASTSSLTTSDVPYDLLLDDEFNSFFDNDNESNDDFFHFNNGDLEYLKAAVSTPDQPTTAATTTTADAESEQQSLSISTSIGQRDLSTDANSNDQHNTTNQISQNDDDPSQALLSEMKEPMIDGKESTLSWHNEQLDKVHRQSMIRLM